MPFHSMRSREGGGRTSGRPVADRGRHRSACSAGSSARTRTVKILAFSDLHRDTHAARAIVTASADADVVVGAGDFATGAEGAAETLRILQICTVPVVLVHGNHDDPEELKDICADWPRGHYLHGDAVALAGVVFFGLGGEIPARHDAPWNVAETEADAAMMLGHCPTGAILVTHTPPQGSADLQKDGTHQGSTAIRDAIRSKHPVLHLCGHIHNAWRMSDRIGGTQVSNLGPGLTWFEV